MIIVLFAALGTITALAAGGGFLWFAARSRQRRLVLAETLSKKRGLYERIATIALAFPLDICKGSEYSAQSGLLYGRVAYEAALAQREGAMRIKAQFGSPPSIRDATGGSLLDVEELEGYIAALPLVLQRQQDAVSALYASVSPLTVEINTYAGKNVQAKLAAFLENAGKLGHDTAVTPYTLEADRQALIGAIREELMAD